jgi:hypothetical protein
MVNQLLKLGCRRAALARRQIGFAPQVCGQAFLLCGIKSKAPQQGGAY